MNIAQWIITAGAVTAALGVMWRGLIRPVLRWGQRIEKAVTIVEQNMVNNGGSSLRDAVDRIEARVVAVEKAVEKKPRSSTVPAKRSTKKGE